MSGPISEPSGTWVSLMSLCVTKKTHAQTRSVAACDAMSPWQHFSLDQHIDVGRLGGGMDGAVQLARAERVDRIEARKQPPALQHPALRMSHAPPHAGARAAPERASRSGPCDHV